MTRELQEHYGDILSLDNGWTAGNEERDRESLELTVTVTYSAPDGKYQCPACRRKAVLNNINERIVRHLDICKYRTWLVVK